MNLFLRLKKTVALENEFTVESVKEERKILRNRIFSVNEQSFEQLACDIFTYQARYNPLYFKWLNALHINYKAIQKVNEIPFLPIRFFKEHSVQCPPTESAHVFESSGTTGMEPSRHYVSELDLYRESFMKGFTLQYGNPENYIILALLPGYLERNNSSLVYMMDELIRTSKNPLSGFYLDNVAGLLHVLEQCKTQNLSVWLIGVSFALLDFSELHPPWWEKLTVVETGGMKGRRKEPVRDELHAMFRKAWNEKLTIHSEYGMTELLSQAWLDERNRFVPPPWMQVRVADTNDPLSQLPDGETGSLQIIDLANLDSCSFIATADLGRRYSDGSFDVLGRFDHSDIRGCNLLIA